MDFGALPPEINSTRMYSGPGSAPMLAAAAAWDGLAAELRSTAASYQSVISSGLKSKAGWGRHRHRWRPRLTPYMTWMSITGAQAEQTASKHPPRRPHYEAAFAATVPPAAVAANRAQLMALVATNFLGQNTAAIAATEAHYGEMWAQDAAAMYSVCSKLGRGIDVEAVQTTAADHQPGRAGRPSRSGRPGHRHGGGTGAQTMLTQLTSAVPNALQSLAAPLRLADPAFGVS